MDILVAGDFCTRGRVGEALKRKSHGDIINSSIRSVIADVDYSIVNLEAPVASEDDECIPYKINLNTTEDAIQWIKDLGFKCVTLANNHIRDYLDRGVLNTISVVNNIGIDHVGAGKNIDESVSVLYKTIDKITLAIVNVCENEFSIADTRPGAAPLDPILNSLQILEAKSKADYVVVIVHGGHEHYQLPSPRMKRTYEWFIDLGADVVINHHQHCYSGIQMYKEKPIFYGIGNFCFDTIGSETKEWNYGFLVKLRFGDIISYELIPYVQCEKELNIRPLDELETKLFHDTLNNLNAVILDDVLLEDSFQNFCTSRAIDMELTLSPYSNRILKGLCRRKIIPSFVTSSRSFYIYNFVNCESHRDVLLNYLRKNGNV